MLTILNVNNCKTGQVERRTGGKEGNRLKGEQKKHHKETCLNTMLSKGS